MCGLLYSMERPFTSLSKGFKLLIDILLCVNAEEDVNSSLQYRIINDFFAAVTEASSPRTGRCQPILTLIR